MVPPGHIIRPGPTPTPITEPFWEGTIRHELRIQQCLECGRTFFYPRSHCPSCWSADLQWKGASGTGTLASYTVIHRPGHPAFVDEAPYAVGLIDLDEDARMLANVDVAAETSLKIGQRLEATWVDYGTYSLPIFRPSSAAGE